MESSMKAFKDIREQQYPEVRKHLKKVGKTREDFAPREPEKIVLQENETLIDDDYEPEYLEE